MTAASQAARPAIPPEEVRTSIDTVLALPEFRPRTNHLDQFLDRVVDWLGDLLPDWMVPSAGTFAWLLQASVWILLGAVLALAAVLVWRRAARRGPAGAAARDPAARRRERVADLRARAREAAARGDHLLALRLEFTALVVGLGEQGDLEYRDGYTNRELLERGRPGPAALGVLQPLVPVLDRKSFGGEPAGPEDVARIASLCDRLLGGARA